MRRFTPISGPKPNARACAARGLSSPLHPSHPKKHLARLKLADLFLDTLPYNAHTTASDALWAGLPLITCRGQAFAGRVAASLLTAMDVPELVTENLKDFETLALRLAQDPALLKTLRDKIAANRISSPLLNTLSWSTPAYRRGV